MIGGEAFSSRPDAQPTGALGEVRSVYRAADTRSRLARPLELAVVRPIASRVWARRLFRDSD